MIKIITRSSMEHNVHGNKVKLESQVLEYDFFKVDMSPGNRCLRCKRYENGSASFKIPFLNIEELWIDGKQLRKNNGVFNFKGIKNQWR